MKRTIIVLSTVLILLFCITSVSFARFMEADETVSGFSNPISQISIQASSPIRVGNSGSTNDWVTINGQFNNPRPNSSYVLHNGVDLQTSISGNTTHGRPAFVVYKGAKIWLKRETISDGYGKFICVQHSFTENNKTYAFQTFYAHMYDLHSGINGTNLLTTDSVGRTGKTSTDTSNPIHLHLEFRSPTSSMGTLGSNMYPPSIFYWYNGAWGNNTSFINHTSTDSIISFRINPMSLGQTYDVPVGDVTLYYKNSIESTWKQTSMSKNGITFSKSISSLGHTPPYTLQYYVKVLRYSGISGTTKYNTWRPYRYISFTQAPDDRPFSKSITSALASIDTSFERMTTEDLQKAGYNNLVQGGWEGDLGIQSQSAVENEKRMREVLKDVNVNLVVTVTEKVSDREWLVREIEGENKIYIMQLSFDPEYLNGITLGDTIEIHAELINKNLLIIPVPEAMHNVKTP